MKHSSSLRIASLALLAALASAARADLTFTQVFTVNKTIPDLGELADTQTVSFAGGAISDIVIGLRIDNLAVSTPAWSGDYYVGLGHDTGYATLLNRIGRVDTEDPFDFGSGHGGLDVVFSDSAATNVNDAPYNPNDLDPPALTGTWKPDGRNPAAPGTPATLSSFNGLSGNGAWELLLADDGEGNAGRLVSWSLSFKITPDSSPIHLTGPGATLTVDTSQTLANDIVNQGLIIAPSGLNQALTLTGHLSGAGGYRGNILSNGSFSPGNSPAAIPFDGDLGFGPGHELTMEIGGLVSGDEHDALNVTQSLTFDGTLHIVFIDGFVPTAGDSFQLFTATSFGGSFSQITFSAFGNFAWDIARLQSSGLLTFAAVPEPSACGAFAGLAALAFAARRTRRRR